MSAAISPVTGRRYGVKRVCAAWDVPRSSFYHHRQQERQPALPHGRRGPKPTISDEALLAAIRADLARSPLTGEGHRKVWGRLRIQRWDPSRSQTGAAPHARAGPALPVPPPPCSTQRPRGSHHHRRPPCPLGHRRRPRLHPRRRLGMDLLRDRALERRVPGHPCGEEGRPVRGTGTPRSGAHAPLRRGHRGGGLWLVPAHGSWHPVPRRRLPEPDPALGDHPRASPSSNNPRPTGSQSASTALSKSRSSTAEPTGTSKSSAPPSPPSSTPTTPNGASKNSAT